MAQFCLAPRTGFGLIAEARSREVAGEALDWAAANPEALEFDYQNKVSRKGHLRSEGTAHVRLSTAWRGCHAAA